MLRGKNKELKKRLDFQMESSELCEHQRCESVELDSGIRLFIAEKNASLQNAETACHRPTLQNIDVTKDLEGYTGELSRMTEKQTDLMQTDTGEGTILNRNQMQTSPEDLKQRVKILKKQRQELLEVNKRWDENFKIMKQRYEQKISETKHKLTDCQKHIADLEAERDQKQRDFDKKLILAKEMIEKKQEENERIYNTLQEVKRQNRGLKEQNASLTRKKEHQECEIGRLNKALSEALKASIRNAGREEMVTQIEVLQQQVQIYEEDFKKERCDRERLNEKNEELQSELNVLKSQAKEFSQTAASPHFPPPRCCSQWVTLPHRAKVYGLSPHYTDTRSPRIHQDRQEDQQHSPNYKWFVSSAERLPPDVQHIPPNHTANGTSQNDNI
ncbi:TNFAIP3-interacting protein 3-like [Acipenser oxyrinchus oxyrinchus]|uniref:TNFAIP3-interacting protein 3-like n=1 Tax=Acipenser oxyrinchus oxyrinchus TaxID=40147 RepID=A0AAD8GJI8_ACIOX|nr:TNFAIP3-interacting protein 3-like [Acipenser oxyrinchus oxyrinchus]